jgi:hypothetical protein
MQWMQPSEQAELFDGHRTAQDQLRYLTRLLRGSRTQPTNNSRARK